MSGELVPIRQQATHRWRNSIPLSHRGTLDDRIVWLWNQRFGTVQTVYLNSPDLLDRTAATLILQAIMGRDLRSIHQILNRLEGGARTDEQLIDSESLRI